MARRFSRIAGDALTDVFQLRAEYQRRRAGVWHREVEVLYPGYLFLQIEDMEAFENALKLTTEYSRLLTVGGDAAPLSAEEADFVRNVGGPDHVVAMSQATLAADVLHIFSGPLMGRERSVMGYNRRKRLAWLSTGFSRTGAGQTKVGLDIVSKT